MNITERTIKEITERMNRLDDIIAKKGLGSEYLDKAHRVQRNLNLTLAAVGAVAIIGIVFWATRRSD